jgi:hypothetical protein
LPPRESLLILLSLADTPSHIGVPRP